jgi:transcriptional regulator with XRE-family HTH domain
MNKDFRRTLGKAARDARKALGLTQENVAERLDVSVEFYGRIERGVAWPSVDVFARMISILGVSADSLLGVEAARASGAAPLIQKDDPLELRDVLDLVCKARPSVVRLVSALVRELERTQAARKSAGARGPDTRKTPPASPR